MLTAALVAASAAVVLACFALYVAVATARRLESMRRGKVRINLRPKPSAADMAELRGAFEELERTRHDLFSHIFGARQ